MRTGQRVGQGPCDGGDGFTLCPLCGDRIGVYEPMIVITRYGARGTSRAREPVLPESDPTFSTQAATASSRMSAARTDDHARDAATRAVAATVVTGW